MKYIQDLREGERLSEIYLCKHKQSALTKNGKPYETITLQDKTGTLDGKIWEPNSQGIDEFEAFDYIQVVGEVIQYQNALQVNVKRVRRASAGEYNTSDYLPTTQKNSMEMYDKLKTYMDSVKTGYLRQLLMILFDEDEDFRERFCKSSAAKSVHHGFVGGLLEHTLSVTKFCDYLAGEYVILNRDLLITAAICHDIGKVKELSLFPKNDYTDEGQLIGHIVLGVQMVTEAISKIEGFPEGLRIELVHCLLSHHGELEFGSPKKPSIAEALALNLADNADAKMQTIKEIFSSVRTQNDWVGYNRLFEVNLKRTGNYEE